MLGVVSGEETQRTWAQADTLPYVRVDHSALRCSDARALHNESNCACSA